MRVRGTLLLFASFFSSVLATQNASAATIYVTYLNQKVAGQGTGGCSLQEAIYSSVLHDSLDGVHGVAISGTDPDTFITTDCAKGDGNDTIVLPTKGQLTMNADVSWDAYNPFGPTATPLVFSNLTLEGNGATIMWDSAASGNVRLFAVGAASIATPNGTASSVGNLTLKNLRIRGFHVKGGDGGKGNDTGPNGGLYLGGGGGLGAGGAIYVGKVDIPSIPTLTVENSTFDSNSALGGNGATAFGHGGGGGGMGGNGVFGGGGARGDGGLENIGNEIGGGGGGGTVFNGGDAHLDPISTNAIGGAGGYLCGGNGGDSGNAGHDGKCPGGGGGSGGSTLRIPATSGDGGKGNYGGGGGGGQGSGGDGGFGGGGGAGEVAVFTISGGNGGFGGGGGAPGSAVSTSPGKGGRFGGNADDNNAGGGGALGGAIFSDGGTITVQNSTFYNNSVTRGVSGGGNADNGGDGGGAIFVRNADLTVENSTFSNNQSTGSGGAIVDYIDDSDPVFSGGNVFTIFTLNNTIIANNGANECFFSGNVHAQGAANLIMQNGTGSQPFGACARPDVTADPQLGPLQDNGGFTLTMAIPFDGAAMSAADPGTSLATDQRGDARPQANGYDIGAYELCRRQLAGGLIEPMFCSETEFAGSPTSSLTIGASTGSGGTVSPTPGTYNEPQNTVVVLSAMPASGYYLKNWSGNVAQASSPTTTIIISNQAQSVTANFQLHDFTLSANPTSFTLPLGGATAVSSITTTALGDFADKITLAAAGQPAGVAVSFNANPLAPIAGTPAASTLTISVGPSVTPQTFTESITGNSTGLSGTLSHSAQLTVNFIVTAAALVNIINQDYTLGCIDNSGILQSLIAKVNAYQKLAAGGHTQAATNVLAAFQYEVQAQTGKHIATTCTDPVGGNQFYTGLTLITDAQALQATLGTQLRADSILGLVLNSANAGVAGVTVNLLSGKSILATTTTDAMGSYYFADVSGLTPGVNYAVTVALPKGYKSSTPSSQSFTWNASQVNSLGNFVSR